jgi:hypothetical protein
MTMAGIDTPIADDTRAYAKYRFFTSVARHERMIRSIDIAVRRDPAVHRPFLCTVAIDLGASGRVKTQARAVHPSGAIDRAAERAAWLLDRRTAGTKVPFSMKSVPFSS